MKFTCSRERLLGGLQIVGSVVSTRGMKPIYESVLIRSREGHLELMGTDLEIAIRFLLDSGAEGDEIRIEEAGSMAVPSARLIAILRELDDEQLEFVWEQNVLSIQCRSSSFKINGLPAEEFPEIPEFPEKAAVTIPADLFKRMVARTEFATAREKMRYALNGILFLLEGETLTMVGTDGRRLAHTTGKVENPELAELKAIVPTKGMIQIARILGEGQETVELALEQNQLAARTSNAVVVSRVLEGTFPPYQEVIPVHCERRARMFLEEFVRAVRKAALLTSRESQSIRCSFEADRLLLTSRALEVGEAQVSMDIEFEGEPAAVAFNPVFILEGLKAMDGERVTFEFRSPTSPARLSDGADFTYVVMPISLD